jgi:SSS family solute:Na+ symporter
VTLHALDVAILCAYFALIAAIGYATARRSGSSTSEYFVAGRSLPGWVVAFTLMGTLIGAGTFVGHPGTSYQKGFILLLPHLLLPVVLFAVARVVAPFYRRVVRMSAYEYIGQRFGFGGRIYTSFGFLADRIFDVGVTLITAALAVNVLTGWELRNVVVGIALFTAAYTMLGGIRAVVWTDVAQGTILILGGTFVLGRLLLAPEAGAPFAVLHEAWRGGRMTLGSWELTWDSLFDVQTTTVWLFLVTYAVQWTRRYVTDQHMVQRYLLARTDAEASRAAVAGAVICVPVYALFILIGACLYGFFSLAQVPGPQLGDNVMPFFMANYLPVGFLGLVVAAILAAAMSTVSSDLTSIATVVTADYFSTAFPRSTDRARLLCGRAMVVVGGLLAAWTAIMLAPEQGLAPIMERALTIAAILSGGTLGLFCLGFLSRTATRRGCHVGIACCLAFLAWAILSQPRQRLVDFGFNFDMNPILIGVFGHLVLFTTGWVASRFLGGYVPPDIESLTFRRRRIAASTPPGECPHAHRRDP